MTEFQEKLLQTFKAFSKFCEENNLTYYAAYGTCLGAVRHHGFIPWDDDIDVFMKRDDYERLLQVRERLSNTIYHISDIRDGEHPYPLGKFYSTEGSVWELRQFQFIIGPWIDIFPLDEWNESEEASDCYDLYHYSLWKYRKALSSQSWTEIWYDFIHMNGMNAPIKLVKKCIYSPFRKIYFHKTQKSVAKMCSIKGPFLKDWCFLKKWKIEKKWFENTIELPFEDTIIICPAGYDEFLTYIYGDYMTPPPLEKRNQRHILFYCDLNNKKTAKEILKEMQQSGDLTKTEAKPLSLRVLINELLHRKGF